MRFLDPAFLWGLGAIGVPIALHLLLRRRLPVLEFPLARLVLRAEHSRQPRKRLNRVLLMLTRVGILALLALALSRMTFGGGDVALQGPVSAVVVVDDSLSMQARAEDGGTLLERGLEMADSFVAALPEGSAVAVIPMSGAGTDARPLTSPASARDALSRVPQTLAHLDAGPALGEALRVLSGGGFADRRLVLVTDLARHGLSDLSLPRWSALSPAQPRRPRVHVLAPRREPGPNLAVSGLDAMPLPGGRLRLVARVAAWGLDRAAPCEIEIRTGLLQGGLRVAGRGRITAGLGASDERRFEIGAPPEGFGRSEASIPADVLPADDVRAAVHHVTQRPRILVVDGDPQNLAIGSETFYVEKALSPGVGLDFEADIVPLAELSPSVVEGRAAILLCNVPELSDERIDALESAVRAGAGLVVSLGNRVDPAVYDGRMARLLPATLGIVREARPGATVAAPEDDAGRRSEPAPMPSLPHVSVRAWYTLQPGDGAGVLLRLSEGSPLLVEGTIGAGRVLLLATTLDRDWTDLPISPLFLPFLRQAIDRARPQGVDVVLPPVFVGEPVPLASLSLGAGAAIVGPDSLEAALPAGAALFAGTTQPGAWLVREDDRPRAAFAVVTDPIESDLTRLSPDELASMMRDAADAGTAIEGSATDAGGIPAWKGLLMLLVCACAAEAWLARRAS